MNLFRICVGVGVFILFSGSAAREFASSRDANAGSQHDSNERGRIVLTKSLPELDGGHLKGILVEVNYGPGEASSPHAHPCAVIGYIAEGSLRIKLQGEPEKIYKAGESFYEAPDRVHEVSANASLSDPAKLVAYLVCDHDAPLSVPAPESTHQPGVEK